MSANFEAKKLVVEDIKNKIQNAKSIVFVKFVGLTVAEDTELRKEFRKNNVEYKVLKNTLIKRAFNDLGEAAKKYENKVAVKSGYVDNQKVDVNGVKSLAAMPSKEELIAKMLGSMQAPLTNFVGVLSAMPRSLVIALNAIAEKQAQ